MVCLVTLPIKQLEDAIVSVNQSGSRKMMPPLPEARDKFAPFAKILVSLCYAILRTESWLKILQNYCQERVKN